MSYSFYMTQNNAMNYLVVENRDTNTWEAAILDWDLSEEEGKEAIKSFLSGKKDPYTDEDGITWARDKENLLPECAKFFGFNEIGADLKKIAEKHVIDDLVGDSYKKAIENVATVINRSVGKDVISKLNFDNVETISKKLNVLFYENGEIAL